MKSSYQKHTVTDKRFLARRARRENAVLLMPLLSTLCFIIGVCLLVAGFFLFSHATLMRWLQFSMLYILAGSIFLLLTLLFRGRERALQRNRRH